MRLIYCNGQQISTISIENEKLFRKLKYFTTLHPNTWAKARTAHAYTQIQSLLDALNISGIRR